HRRIVQECVVAGLVPAGFDAGNDILLASSSLANQEEGGLGVVSLENVEDLGREGRVWAIIEGKGHQGTIGPNSISDVGRESLEHTQDTERLYREHHEPHPEECNRVQAYGPPSSTSP